MDARRYRMVEDGDSFWKIAGGDRQTVLEWMEANREVDPLNIPRDYFLTEPADGIVVSDETRARLDQAIGQYEERLAQRDWELARAAPVDLGGGFLPELAGPGAPAIPRPAWEYVAFNLKPAALSAGSVQTRPTFGDYASAVSAAVRDGGADWIGDIVGGMAAGGQMSSDLMFGGSFDGLRLMGFSVPQQAPSLVRYVSNSWQAGQDIVAFVQRPEVQREALVWGGLFNPYMARWSSAELTGRAQSAWQNLRADYEADPLGTTYNVVRGGTYAVLTIGSLVVAPELAAGKAAGALARLRVVLPIDVEAQATTFGALGYLRLRRLSPAQRAANNGYPLIGTTASGGPDFAGTPYLFPAGRGQSAVVSVPLTGSRRGDNRAAFRLAGIRANDHIRKNYRWHHMDDFDPSTGRATLQLVEAPAHRATSWHEGAVRQWELFHHRQYRR